MTTQSIQEAFQNTINNSAINGRLRSILASQFDCDVETAAQYILNQFAAVEPSINTDDNFDYILDKLLIVQGQAV